MLRSLRPTHVFKTLLENRGLTAATTLAALSGALQKAVKSFGIPPFWSDLLLAGLILYAVLHWVGSARTLLDSTAHAGFSGELRPRSTVARIRFRLFSAKTWGFLVIMTGLVALLAWSSRSPIDKLVGDGAGRWQVCGEVRTSCRDLPCARLLDRQERPVSNDCFPLLDATGFLQVEQPGRWSYRPVTLQAECGGTVVASVSLPEELFSPYCDGSIEVR